MHKYASSVGYNTPENVFVILKAKNIADPLELGYPSSRNATFIAITQLGMLIKSLSNLVFPLRYIM